MSDDIREEQYLADIRTAAQGGEGYYDLDPIIRKEFYYTDIINALKNGGGGGGGGFTPTDAQLAAMNSGITAERLGTDETNISLKANTSDVNTATASLQAQIDQIAQAAGTGSADTEVAQARVGADGTSYQTLKARLDGENSELKEDLSQLSESIDEIASGEIIEETVPITKTTDGIELKDGYYITTDGSLGELNAYYTYIYKLKDDGDLYFGDTPTNSAVLMFAVYDGYPSALTFKGTRYRMSDDNLPKASNKLRVNKDQYIAVSVYLNVSASQVYFDLKEDILVVGNKVFGDISLNKEQVSQANFKNKIYVRHIDNSGLDNSTERIEICVPTKKGFIRYDLLHCVSAPKNANVWRMGYAYKVDDDFENEVPLTESGEWECALHLNNSGDYTGGITHGNEILDDVIFFANGCKVNTSDLSDYIALDSFEVVSVSKMYDSTDSTRQIAEHGCEHIFKNDGLNIKQSVEWKNSEQLTWCYMAMNVPKKTSVNKFFTNRKIVPRDIEYGVHNNVNETVLFSDSVSNEFSVDKYPLGMSGGDSLLIADNGGNPYAKCYYVICSSGNVASGTVWESSSHYKFNAN